MTISIWNVDFQHLSVIDYGYVASVAIGRILTLFIQFCEEKIAANCTIS